VVRKTSVNLVTAVDVTLVRLVHANTTARIIRCVMGTITALLATAAPLPAPQLLPRLLPRLLSSLLFMTRLLPRLLTRLMTRLLLRSLPQAPSALTVTLVRLVHANTTPMAMKVVSRTRPALLLAPAAPLPASRTNLELELETLPANVRTTMTATSTLHTVVLKMAVLVSDVASVTATNALGTTFPPVRTPAAPRMRRDAMAREVS
jgi:hypothetical protein